MCDATFRQNQKVLTNYLIYSCRNCILHSTNADANSTDTFAIMQIRHSLMPSIINIQHNATHIKYFITAQSNTVWWGDDTKKKAVLISPSVDVVQLDEICKFAGLGREVNWIGTDDLVSNPVWKVSIFSTDKVRTV
jgi:hypothetical protein